MSGERRFCCARTRAVWALNGPSCGKPSTATGSPAPVEESKRSARVSPVSRASTATSRRGVVEDDARQLGAAVDAHLRIADAATTVRVGHHAVAGVDEAGALDAASAVVGARIFTTLWRTARTAGSRAGCPPRGDLDDLLGANGSR